MNITVKMIVGTMMIIPTHNFLHLKPRLSNHPEKSGDVKQTLDISTEEASIFDDDDDDQIYVLFSEDE